MQNTWSIELVPVETNKNLLGYYLDNAVRLVKYHQKYAEDMGVVDNVVIRYNEEKAGRYIGKPGYHHYVIQKNGINVGIAQIEILEPEDKEAPVMYIHKTYIEELARGTEILSEMIEILKELFPYIKVITFECWYNLPADKIYKHMGFKPIMTKYMKEV